MENSDLGTRMKKYEDVSRFYLQPRTPMILRIDGKAFHSFTKHCVKPFDKDLHKSMEEVAKALLKEVQGAKLVYFQSDELSVLITDYETHQTEAWFQKNLQKIVSVSASVATANFNKNYTHPKGKLALFDSRAFTIPKEEVNNYFYWRQLDAVRNSIQMLGQFHFSHKELYKKSCSMIQEMLFQQKGINWNNTPTSQKRGTCVYKAGPDGIIGDYEIPQFNINREYIERFL